MLLALMYHYVNADRFSNRDSVLREHLHLIKNRFPVVLPGEDLSNDAVNICLVFDDAGFDFYYYVYPILQSLGLRAVLAVPVKYILDDAGSVESNTRLNVPALAKLDEETSRRNVTLCTWKELHRMTASGLISIASHSFTHRNLLQVESFEEELSLSKELLEKKLSKPVDTFVYPYADFNAAIHNVARRYYRYIFSAGVGDNRNWRGIDGVLFRISADNLRNADELFTPSKLLMYRYSFAALHLKKRIKDRQRLQPAIQ